MNKSSEHEAMKAWGEKDLEKVVARGQPVADYDHGGMISSVAVEGKPHDSERAAMDAYLKKQRTP